MRQHGVLTRWLIGVRGEVPRVEALATAEDVQRCGCGPVRWSDGTPGPAVAREDTDWITTLEHGAQEHTGTAYRLNPLIIPRR